MTTTPAHGTELMASRGCKCAFCDAYRNQTSKTPSNSSLGDLAADPTSADPSIEQEVEWALAHWHVAVQHGDEGPEEFEPLLDLASRIAEEGGPLAERAEAAVEQFEMADMKGDISVDDEQEIVDTVIAWQEANPVIEPVTLVDPTEDSLATEVAEDVAALNSMLGKNVKHTVPKDANIQTHVVSGAVESTDFPDVTTEKASVYREVNGAQRLEIVQQIGRGNLGAISGGRVTPIEHGVELPVGRGYRVRVRLLASDTYEVERAFVRGGKEWSYGKRDGVHAEQVGEIAYYASCYGNDSGKEWTYMGR